MIKKAINWVFWSYLFSMALYLVFVNDIFMTNRHIVVMFGQIMAINIVLVLFLKFFELVVAENESKPRKRFKKLNMKNTFGVDVKEVYENEVREGYLESFGFVLVVNCLTSLMNLKVSAYNFVLAFMSNGKLQLLVVGFLLFAVLTDNFVPGVAVEAVEEFLKNFSG